MCFVPQFINLTIIQRDFELVMRYYVLWFWPHFLFPIQKQNNQLLYSVSILISSTLQFFSIFFKFQIRNDLRENPKEKEQAMTELNLKTKLTPAEKFIVVFGITLFGICASTLIGKNLPIQLLLSALILYLITGRRPTIVYASVMKCHRDFT